MRFFFHVVEAPIVTSLLINSVDFGPELPANVTLFIHVAYLFIDAYMFSPKVYTKSCRDSFFTQK